MRPSHSQVMVPYVMKIPPQLLARVKAESIDKRNTRGRYRPRLTVSAFIRRAIERDLAHAARSRRTTR